MIMMSVKTPENSFRSHFHLFRYANAINEYNIYIHGLYYYMELDYPKLVDRLISRFPGPSTEYLASDEPLDMVVTAVHDRSSSERMPGIRKGIVSTGRSGNLSFPTVTGTSFSRYVHVLAPCAS
jgi:hypothetical protein